MVATTSPSTSAALLSAATTVAGLAACAKQRRRLAPHTLIESSALTYLLKDPVHVAQRAPPCTVVAYLEAEYFWQALRCEDPFATTHPGKLSTEMFTLRQRLMMAKAQARADSHMACERATHPDEDEGDGGWMGRVPEARLEAALRSGPREGAARKQRGHHLHQQHRGREYLMNHVHAQADHLCAENPRQKPLPPGAQLAKSLYHAPCTQT